MRKKHLLGLLLICLLSLVTQQGFAQTRTITGVVKDDNNVPLPGASVAVKNSTVATSTNSNGSFSLSVPASATRLTVSSVGFGSKEVAIGKEGFLTIVLSTTTAATDTVVVVAYGQQKKASVTASISTINSRELVQSPVANISNGLAGRLPGLIAIQNTGKPGSDGSDLYIRGIGTFNGATTPLIMVDGVIRETYNDIDPNEVESISILKDASATAVFGVRGANGVVLITTKRGKEGTPKVSATAQTAMTQFIRLPNYVNAYQYATLRNEQISQIYWQDHARDADVFNQADGWAKFLAKKSSDPSYKPQYSEEDLKYFQNAHTPKLADGSANPYYDPYFHPDMDWQGLIFKKFAHQSQVNVNVSGGTRGVKYFLSGGYLSQRGLFKTDYMPFTDEMDYSKTRYNWRGNFDFDVNKDFKIALDLGTQFVQISGMNNDGYNYEKNLMWTNPMASPGYIDGKFAFIDQSAAIQGQGGAEQFNPLYSLSMRNQYNLNNNSTLNSAIRLSHKLDFITRGLSVHVKGSYDSYFSSTSGGQAFPVSWSIRKNPNGDKLDPIWVRNNNESPSQRWNNWYSGKWRKMYAEAAFNYSRNFGDHAVSALAMGNLEKTFDPNLAYGLPHAYEGLVGRVTYGFRDKYLAEVNAGYNGSENFPPGKRFDLFPAYSLGWVASKESFWPENQYVTFLKIRGSLGWVGNDKIGGSRYLYLPDVWGTSGGDMGGYYFGINGSNRNRVNGAYEATLGNPNITWEKARKMNVGFEAKFFNNKLSVTYDHFNEHRKDILWWRGTVPAVVAASLPPYNLGIMDNWGNEVELIYNGRISREFNYWVKGNVANNKNKIIYMDEPIVKGLEYQSQTGRPFRQGSYLQDDGLYTTWAQLYAVDKDNNPILSQPVLAKDASGNPYKNAAGQDVYERDLSLGGKVLQPGDIKIKDVNFDGIIDNKDYVRSGNTKLPRYTYGMSFGFTYKGFDFSALFQGAAGVAADPMPSTNLHFNGTTEALFEVDWNRFNPERYASGETIDFPIAAYNRSAYVNTFFHLNTSYVRLKNCEIGYTFRPGVITKLGIGSVRAYVNGYNLYTWSQNSIWGDPENMGFMGYPLTRSYNAGLKVSF